MDVRSMSTPCSRGLESEGGASPRVGEFEVSASRGSVVTSSSERSRVSGMPLSRTITVCGNGGVSAVAESEDSAIT